MLSIGLVIFISIPLAKHILQKVGALESAVKFLALPTLTLNLACTQADTFCVANFGGNSITRYDDNSSGSPFTAAFVNGPNGIALDSSGNLYIATSNNTIEKFAPGRADLGVLASPGINLAMGLAFDQADNLYARRPGR
jgi:DNA-binding beta-propeller fold protein YncE